MTRILAATFSDTVEDADSVVAATGPATALAVPVTLPTNVPVMPLASIVALSDPRMDTFT